MKDTIFDYTEEEVKKENVVYHFQPTQRLDAIKTVIMDRYKQKQTVCIPSSPPIEHIGGLPSPPVEDKKPELEEDLSCQDIQAKIDLLKQEKHRLFQLIKHMMLQEQLKKREKLILEQQEKKWVQEHQEPQEKKKRWDSTKKPTYFYSRPRYNNYTPIQHRTPRSYNSRPPYSS